MLTIGRGQVLSGGRPPLDLFVASGGFLTNVYSLAFTLIDVPTRTQIFPPTGRQTVDVASAGRLGIGHYFAGFTVPAEALLGIAELHWFYQLTATSPEVEVVTPLVISAAAPSYQPGYIAVPRLRGEGVSAADGDDARLGRAIFMASQYIERVTERWFEPRRLVVTLDGDGASDLELPAPIIALESVRIAGDGDFEAVEDLDPASLRIYARHVTEGILSPDDRSCPKIERLGRCRWPEGNRNIQVIGVFGYTDFDGTPMGRTPELIMEACTMLAIKRVEKRAISTGFSGPVKREKTRDQEIEYSEASKVSGAFTGDPELDMILESFRRPPVFSAV